MAETCIVCLGDLASASCSSPDQPVAADDKLRHATGAPSTAAAHESSNLVKEDDETIAHLLPCGHNLHNACLKPWVERANSCPICRASFIEVQLSASIGGK